MKKFVVTFAAAGLLSLISGCQKHTPTPVVHPALQMQPVPSGLGVNIHFYQGNRQDFSLLTEAGVDTVRMDVFWSVVEIQKGRYDFSYHDQLIKDLEDTGIRLLFIIDYSNNIYDNGRPPKTEEAREACARMCSALAKRYAGKNIIWELWNEPNIERFWEPRPDAENYVGWCKHAVAAIRQADPNACIVAPASSGIDFPFLEACFRNGLLQLVDGVSVHPYRDASHGPETVFKDYERLKELIERHRPRNRMIPVLCTEWGYPAVHISKELQGKYLAREWLCNMAQDIPVSIWYEWRDGGRSPDEAEHNYGTLTRDYSPKPAYLAMKTLISQFRDFTPRGRWDLGSSDDDAVLFSRDDEMTLALWTTGKPHEVTLRNGLRISESINYLGQPVSPLKKTGLFIDDGPVYVRIKNTLYIEIESSHVEIAIHYLPICW